MPKQTRSSVPLADYDGESAQFGSQPDISQLVVEYHEDLFRYAYRLSGSQADAEDLTQQAYLIAQHKLGQLRNSDRARSWLFTVLRNCFLKSRRRKTIFSASSLQLDVDAIPDDYSSEDNVDREQLQLALNELAPEFRVVVTMFYFEQLSYKEIADQLQVPVGTVMSRLSRAKGHLRRRLLPEFEVD